MKANTDPAVPNALRDVWAWKDAVYRQTEKMTFTDTPYRPLIHALSSHPLS
jgi:hypothetical protein